MVIQATSYEKYQYAILEKYKLEQRLSETDDIANDHKLYKDIVNFNSKVRYNKKYKNNLFLNWFTYKDIADNIDYIKIDLKNRRIK